jgi:hypothetical protein
MNQRQLSRLPLSPELVDCIVFWTKDAHNILPRLKEIDSLGYSYIFQHTLTPYGKKYEPGLRDKTDIEDDFIKLSKRIGRNKVIWRYDPIILDESMDISFHKDSFSRLCEKLSGYTNRVVISYVDLYSKMKKSSVREAGIDEIIELSDFIGGCAREHKLTVSACCEKADLSGFGIEKSSCIDRVLIEEALGCRLDIRKDKNQREGCGCYESIDIGAYDTCPGGCIYCYANRSYETAVKRFSQHEPQGELLFGKVYDNELIKVRKLRSNKLPLL